MLALLAACGGQDHAAPVPNQPPVPVQPLTSLSAVTAHPVDVDLTAGGTAARDPEGDPLSWRAQWVGAPPAGLSLAGARLLGVPTTAGRHLLRVQVMDGRGGSLQWDLTLDIAANRAPPVSGAIAPRLVAVGEFVDIEALTAGATFGADPERDAVEFTVTLHGSAQGLAVNGTRISGRLSAVGAVRARVTATDAHGARSLSDFVIAAPAADPGRPVLPQVADTYAPERLPLPVLMQPGPPAQGPLWDTTPADNPVTDAGATLGRVLFFDRRLSATQTHACASCHQPQNGFADAARFSTGVTGEPSPRNAMALANVGYNRDNRFFSDIRTTTLEALVLQPVEDPTELGFSVAQLVPRLAATDFYPPLFAAAFGSPQVTAERIAQALAQFLRSLRTYRAPFDRVFNPPAGQAGEPVLAVFSAQALAGQGVFNEQACGVCHREVLQVMNVPSSNGLDVVPRDPGAGAGRFRSASLRNIARTAPYMHDGRFATLREVIDHYDHGMVSVDANTSALADPLTGGPRRMNLGEAQKQALEAFLHTLTDEALLADPRFADPFP